MPEHYGIELFVQFEYDAAEKAEPVRARGLTVEMHAAAGGYALAISGPAAAMVGAEPRGRSRAAVAGGRVLTGTVRWWKDEKGYGRITGDDGYIYFCRFSALQMEGYKTLRAGQRVEFERVEGMAGPWACRSGERACDR